MVRKIIQKESFRQKVQLCSFYNINLWFPLSMSVYWFAYFFSNKRQYCVEVIGAVPHFGFHHNIYVYVRIFQLDFTTHNDILLSVENI